MRVIEKRVRRNAGKRHSIFLYTCAFHMYSEGIALPAYKPRESDYYSTRLGGILYKKKLFLRAEVVLATILSFLRYSKISIIKLEKTFQPETRGCLRLREPCSTSRIAIAYVQRL